MKIIIISVFFLLVSNLQANFVQRKIADSTALKFISDFNKTSTHSFIDEPELIDGKLYLYNLFPVGFIIISARSHVEAVLGYSFKNAFVECSNKRSVVFSILRNYMEFASETISDNRKIVDIEQWPFQEHKNYDFEQWPPPGTTITGGWLETNWSQNSPYNNMCPIDPTTSMRSVAGCPSIAFGQIINYHRSINGTRLGENDRYRMYYSGSNNYFIDDAAVLRDFPSFLELNYFLDEIEVNYTLEGELDSELKSALIFASGIAIKQVYSSTISGNYFNPQIVNAYHRFGYDSAVTLFSDSPMLLERMIDNMKRGLPAQLSLLTSDGAGHQVVLDGFNTNNEFHMNFGWGGQANGWYSFPFWGMPYQLNIFGSVVLDIYQNWEGFPDFELVIHDNSMPITCGKLTYEIVKNSGDIEHFFVFLENDLINQTSTGGFYDFSLTGKDNGFYNLSVVAMNGEGMVKEKNVNFKIGTGEIVFSEDFEESWTDHWIIESSVTDFTWQSLDNSFEAFSNINSQSTSSATCPTAYSNINEKMISPEILLPKSENLVLLFYAAFSDMYLHYPNLKLRISTDNGITWDDLWQASIQGDDWSWFRISLDLSSYSGKTVLLQFVATGFSYCDVSIDHLRIYNLTSLQTEDLSVKPGPQVQTYPNPFYVNGVHNRNSDVTINFSLPERSRVLINVYDIRGRKQNVLLNEKRDKGSHSIIWNGFSSQNKSLSSGIYFVNLITDYSETVTKIMLLR